MFWMWNICNVEYFEHVLSTLYRKCVIHQAKLLHQQRSEEVEACESDKRALPAVAEKKEEHFEKGEGFEASEDRDELPLHAW